MAELLEEQEAAVETQPVQAEDLLGLNPDIIRDVIVALDNEDAAAIREIVAPLHPAEVADLIEMMRGPMRTQLVEILRQRFDPVILAELDETLRDEVAEQLGTQAIARAIAALDSDDALNLISALEETMQRSVLHAVPAALRAMIEEGLTFPEDSAGRLMQREFVAVPAFWTVGEVIDFLRESDDLPDDFYDIFVVDPRHRLIGAVALNKVLRTKRPVPIREIMMTEILTVPLEMDQE
ncbi:MAG: magnesium transporter, partial [Alphaproteobacteria bacterium]